MNNTTLSATHASALAYLDAGFCVIPLLLNGSKHAAVSWKEYQQHKPTHQQLDGWFARDAAGIGIICGAVSGGLEVLDFDSSETASGFLKQANTAGLEGIVQSMWRVMTPSYGLHLYYRHTATPEGNMKLAMDETSKKVLAETRGEGGYVVAPGSPKDTHTKGKLYKPLLNANGFTALPVLTAEERHRVLAYARSFDRRIKAVPPVVVDRPVLRPLQPSTGERAGDAFNRQASWEDVLLPHGWVSLRTTGSGMTYWQRAGARTSNHDAVSNKDGSDRLWVFSTSTGLQTDCYLNKFAAYAQLNHAGNFAEATKALAAMGYGGLGVRRVA